MKVTIESGESKFVFTPAGLEELQPNMPQGMPSEPECVPDAMPADCCSARPPFCIGDSAVLRSGGPIMTVADIGPNGDRVCKWFNGGELVATDFNSACLRQPTPFDQTR